MGRSTGSILRDYALTILIAVTAAFLIRTYFIEAYRVTNGSMTPALLKGETLFVKKWPFSVSSEVLPARGDVVLFADYSAGSNTEYSSIKRVIALPGDTVALKKGQLYLNGKNLVVMRESGRLFETLPEGKTYEILYSRNGFVPKVEFGPQKVPMGSVFVMGDNRDELGSHSRKIWSFVPLERLKGQAFLIWLSPSLASSNKKVFWPQFRKDRMFRRVD